MDSVRTRVEDVVSTTEGLAGHSVLEIEQGEASWTVDSIIIVDSITEQEYRLVNNNNEITIQPI